MLDGRIEHCGTFQELTAAGVDLAAYVPLPAQSDEADSPAPGPGRGEPALAPRPRPESAPASPAPPAPPAAPAAAAAAGKGGGGRAGAGGSPAAAAAEPSMVPFMRLPSLFGGPRGQGLLSFASHKPFKFEPGQGPAPDALPGGAKAPLPDVEGADDDAARGEEAAGAGGLARKGSGAEAVRRRLGRLVMAEHRARGQVKRSIYLAYLAAWGPLFLLPITIAIGTRRRTL
jgi:hypothetical protein